jgi:hypothetical protein
MLAEDSAADPVDDRTTRRFDESADEWVDY